MAVRCGAVRGSLSNNSLLPCRVWVIIMPRIPNPSKNFDDLFITHNGDFQVSWLPWLTTPPSRWQILTPLTPLCPSRNGSESLKMWWRVSSPTTVRASAM